MSTAACFEDVSLKGTALTRRDLLRLDHVFGQLVTQACHRVGGPARVQPTWETPLPWGEQGILELDPVWPTLRVHSVCDERRMRAWPVPLDCLSPVDRAFLEVECRWSTKTCVIPEYLSPTADPDRSLVETLCRASSWMEYAHRAEQRPTQPRLERAG
jgi:hypothetical protein